MFNDELGSEEHAVYVHGLPREVLEDSYLVLCRHHEEEAKELQAQLETLWWVYGLGLNRWHNLPYEEKVRINDILNPDRPTGGRLDSNMMHPNLLHQLACDKHDYPDSEDDDDDD